MDHNDDYLAGLPCGLYALLHSLGEDDCRAAIWNLRRTKSRFYLDIQWPKKEPFILPAQKSCEQPHLVKKAQDGPIPPGFPSENTTVRDRTKVIAGVRKLTGNWLSVQPKSDKPVVASTRKKRKSPSTRKRNRLRWEQWQAKKRTKT